jgi:hypothetical protein
MNKERDELKELERKLRRELADVPASESERREELMDELLAVRSMLVVDTIVTRAILESREDDDVP